MQWIFVLCGCIFLLSLTATYQVCSVSLKAGQSTYKGSGADACQPLLMPRSLLGLAIIVAVGLFGGPKLRRLQRLPRTPHPLVITVSANPKVVTAVGRVLKDASLSCFLYNHRARESHGLTGQHRSHMVPDEVHDTAIPRFGGSVILTPARLSTSIPLAG